LHLCLGSRFPFDTLEMVMHFVNCPPGSCVSFDFQPIP
jgi:hypothetical protein